MKLVVGLGNPGPRYVGTRHNVGFRIAQAVGERFGLGWAESPFEGMLARDPRERLALLMPATFMNASGRSVRAAVEALGTEPVSDLVVAFDDLDLPLGRIRLRASGGCGGHRGMESIADELGSQDFARLRFGIGRPPRGDDIIEYVLAPFTDDEEAALADDLERCADAIAEWMDVGIERAMERINRRAVPAPEES